MSHKIFNLYSAWFVVGEDSEPVEGVVAVAVQDNKYESEVSPVVTAETTEELGAKLAQTIKINDTFEIRDQFDSEMDIGGPNFVVGETGFGELFRIKKDDMVTIIGAFFDHLNEGRLFEVERG